VEALHQGYPVLCYGEAVYRHFPAVYCLTNATAETHAITRELANNQCTLDRAAIAGMVARIQAQQWQPEDVPLKLPALLQSLAWPGVRPAESHAFLRQTYHWLMNLPSRILYRHRWREIKIIL
jgi:hypothetical protein